MKYLVIVIWTNQILDACSVVNYNNLNDHKYCISLQRNVKKEGEGISQSFLNIRRKPSEKPLLQGKGATSKVE